MLEMSISRTKAGAGTLVLPLAARSLTKAAVGLSSSSRPCLCVLVMPGLANIVLCLAHLSSATMSVLGKVLLQEIVMTLARKLLLAVTRRTARRPILRVDLAPLLLALANSLRINTTMYSNGPSGMKGM